MKRDPVTGRILKMTKDEFVDKSRKIHGNKYDYSKVNYTGSGNPVTIICPDHGDFKQLPNSHLSQMSGCRLCGRNKTHASNRYTREEWITKANNIHDFKYDYSKSIYTNGEEKIVIGCKKHGDFYQTLEAHFQGRGCPKCKTSKGEEVIQKWMKNHGVKYVFQMTFDDCKNPTTNYKLKFDFYVPDKQLLIEFDGMQHFKEITNGRFTVSKERLEKSKYRDKLKTDYAKRRGMKLLRISYKEFRKIHQILSNEI